MGLVEGLREEGEVVAEGDVGGVGVEGAAIARGGFDLSRVKDGEDIWASYPIVAVSLQFPDFFF